MYQQSMLHLILTESALETMPNQLWTHPSIVNRAKKMRKQPKHMLLDRSYHHHAMHRLSQAEKRGRPDIVHFSLLEALGTPLNKANLLNLFVHTLNNFVISVDSQIRLPRNYNRFVGLLEQLYQKKRVPVTSPPLLKLSSGSLETILAKIQNPYVVSLTRTGAKIPLHRVFADISSKRCPVILIGAFPHGHFSEKTVQLSDVTVSIDSESLQTAIVTSRVIYEYEKHIGLPKLRWKRPTLDVEDSE
jgi:rRNA small subunit pseudouridine methyltransferase Nep1